MGMYGIVAETLGYRKGSVVPEFLIQGLHVRIAPDPCLVIFPVRIMNFRGVVERYDAQLVPF